MLNPKGMSWKTSLVFEISNSKKYDQRPGVHKSDVRGLRNGQSFCLITS